MPDDPSGRSEADAVGLPDAVIVITGAGRGLGRAYAHEVAGAGALAVVNDVDAGAAAAVVAEIRAAGGVAEADTHDVTDAAAAAALIQGAAARHGRLDGLVTNAGLRPEGPAWAEDVAAVRRAVEVNLLGTLFCGIPALAIMRDQGRGSLVTVSSRAQSGIRNSATYAATKGAIATLTRSWALDLLGSGVWVNAIAPQAGLTGTRRASTPADPNEPTPQQMAALVRYLLSDRAAPLTGQVLRFGGRRDALSLGLMTQPGNDVMFTRAGTWRASDIAELVETRLLGRIGPLGADGAAVVSTPIGGVDATAEERPGL